MSTPLTEQALDLAIQAHARELYLAILWALPLIPMPAHDEIQMITGRIHESFMANVRTLTDQQAQYDACTKQETK